ncbi:hypothetical protein FB446DRAFT_823227 [Lentinula raphanica]|nr:hypothetical protein FB446DRAFT_823227 [Lentinula raphanica]
MLFIRRVFHLSRFGPSPVVARNKKRDASADGVPLRIVRVGSNCDTLHRVIPAATVPLSPAPASPLHKTNPLRPMTSCALSATARLPDFRNGLRSLKVLQAVVYIPPMSSSHQGPKKPLRRGELSSWCFRETLRVPSFVEDVISRASRKDGNIRRLGQLTEAIDRDPLFVDLSQDDAVQLAKERLTRTARTVDDWIVAFAHMDEVTGSEMDFGNLAILICPSILYPRHGSMNSSPYQRSSYQSNTPWNSMARISRKKCDTYQKAEAVNGRLPTLGPYNGPNGSTPRIGPGSGPINSPIVPRERPPPPPASQRPYGVSQPIPSYPSASSQHGHIGNMNTPRTPQTEEWTSQRAPVTPSGPLTPSRPSSYTGHSWSYVSRGGKVKVETTRYFPATSHRDPKTTPRSSIIFSITYATYVHWQS